MVDLEQKLKELIAHAHSVPVEQVTSEFIEEQRETLYALPSHRFVDQRPGMMVMTPAQIEAERATAQAFLAGFAFEQE